MKNCEGYASQKRKQCNMGGLHGEKFEELYSLFRKAEAAMKVVEEWQGDLIVPSINQLRYAGGHLLNFFVAG